MTYSRGFNIIKLSLLYACLHSCLSLSRAGSLHENYTSSEPGTSETEQVEKAKKRRNHGKHMHSHKRKQKFSNHNGLFLKHYSDDFQTNWCRMHEARLDWRKYLAPCAEQTQWSIKDAGWKNIKMKTDATKSFISRWDIRPAGEFSRFFIQSKTSSNDTKSIGGDSWRIHINGTSSVSATVFDHNNGVYEIIFLVMEAGLYHIEIKLDYTLCDGFKDPPEDWYKKGCVQGKNQHDGILKGDRPFLGEPFNGGKCIVVKVPDAKYSRELQTALAKTRNRVFTGKAQKKPKIYDDCPSLIFNGLGRWINRTWKPFFEDVNIHRDPHHHRGLLWIYGDSISKRFADSLKKGPYSKICTTAFKSCKTTYTWIYNLKYEWLQMSKFNGKDYDHEKVMAQISKVLDDRRLDEHSVIMLNWGIHFVYAVNFTNYKKLIDDFLKMVGEKKRSGQFKGKIIWRTTTAIFRERIPKHFCQRDADRFLTFPRIILYNAYAMSAMCKAGVDVIDVYSMTDSFPPGTESQNDALHYGNQALKGVEKFLHDRFKPNVQPSGSIPHLPKFYLTN